MQFLWIFREFRDFISKFVKSPRKFCTPWSFKKWLVSTSRRLLLTKIWSMSIWDRILTIRCPSLTLHDFIIQLTADFPFLFNFLDHVIYWEDLRRLDRTHTAPFENRPLNNILLELHENAQPSSSPSDATIQVNREFFTPDFIGHFCGLRKFEDWLV